MFFQSLAEVYILSSRPNPFSCSFFLRDDRARELVLADTMAR